MSLLIVHLMINIKTFSTLYFLHYQYADKTQIIEEWIKQNPII
jgi:hypothetical protein